MNPDISFLHDLWDSVKAFIPKKERLQVAEAIVRTFDDNADIESVEDSLSEFDSVMKAALTAHFDIGLEDDDEDDDYGEY
jgi:hypothetical protein